MLKYFIRMKIENPYKIRKLKFFDIFEVWSMYKSSSKELKEYFMLAHNLKNFLLRFIFKRMDGFVCLNEKKIIGFVFLFYLRKKDVKTLGIMVKEDYQGKGIGRRLMSAILKNQNKVRLGIVKSNKKAINLYKSFGFKETKKSNLAIFDRKFFVGYLHKKDLFNSIANLLKEKV
ncbi:hypothetical protein LCGC14_2065090 [marine sediment metagenome]|uniref:N-acetyltransferase domain-containing protein n=1 Tax=marine sediment metagenome TaxID=412755 RepID=A0A0F9HH33_9ZZZZ